MKYMTYLRLKILKKSALLSILAFSCAMSISAFQNQGLASNPLYGSGAGLLGGLGRESMPDMQISDDDMKAFYSYLQNLDEKDWEEIEQMSKQILNDMGFNPETLQPLGDTSAAPEFQPTDLPANYPEDQAADGTTASSTTTQLPTALISYDQLNALLSTSIDHLTMLRYKLSLPASSTEVLRGRFKDIGDLIYLLKVVNQPKHYSRITAPEYNTIRTALEVLHKALATYEPLITVQQESTAALDEPFELLGISPQATQSEIDAAYQRLKNQQSPESVEKLFTSDQTPVAREKLLKEATLNFNFLTDAYDRIKDPQSRALLKTEKKALQEAERVTSTGNLRAGQILAKSITTAVHQEELIKHLEDFLKKYEPIQLEERKRQEQATQDRIKEQEASGRVRLQRKPLTIGQQRDWYGGYQPPYRAPDYGYNPGMQARNTGISDSPSQAAISPGLGKSKGDGAAKKSAPGKANAKQANKPKDNKEKDKEQEKKSGDKEKTLDSKQGPDKQAQNSVVKSPEGATTTPTLKNLNPTEKFLYYLDDLDKNIATFNKKFDKENFKQLQENPIAPEQFAPFVQKFKEDTGLEDIKNTVSQVKRSFKGADERTKKQYTTLWSGIEKNKSEFKKNIHQARKTIQTHSSSYHSAQEPRQEPESPQTILMFDKLNQAEQLVNTIAKDVEEIEKIVKPPVIPKTTAAPSNTAPGSAQSTSKSKPVII